MTQPQTQTLKYILFVDDAGVETPVLFPPWLNHNTVADALRETLTPVSAGFVTLRAAPGTGKASVSVVTHGASDSLNLVANPGDAEFIEQFLQ